MRLLRCQLEQIIKFGLDQLFQSDDNSAENMDFTAMLGPTVDGNWHQPTNASAATTVSIVESI